MTALKSSAILISLSLLLAACGSTPPAAAVVDGADNPGASGGSQPTPGSDMGWLIGQSREDAQGAVTVNVTALGPEPTADSIEFSVAMNTHSVDLNMDLAALATLTTDTGLTVDGLLWGGPLGGHHVEGTLSFPATVDGASVLDGANMLTLIIRDVDAAERIFTWQR